MDERRSRFDDAVASLVGRTIEAVEYWDVPPLDGDLEWPWDQGDWHHAVIGVQLITDDGEFGVAWTDTFFPYGIEVLPGPATQFAWPTGRRVTTTWPRRGPIRSTSVWWETFTGTTEIWGKPSIDVPLALRLVFDDGPVWMANASPQGTEPETFFVPGDDIAVIFDRKRLHGIGFTDPAFSRTDLTSGPDNPSAIG